jgi:hypothetical protein
MYIRTENGAEVIAKTRRELWKASDNTNMAKIETGYAWERISLEFFNERFRK